LLNQINSNNSIDKSSASVYNIVGLSQAEDNIIYIDNVLVNVNSQVLTSETVNEGSLQIAFDKNVLEVEDIIMPADVIAKNQKIDTASGIITLDITSANSTGFKNISSLAQIIFNKKQDFASTTTVTLLSSSTLGSPNTLDASDKLLTISL
jgi:hypothetical protein